MEGKTEDSKPLNEIKVGFKSRVRNIVNYANILLKENNFRSLNLSAIGGAIGSLVNAVEVLKINNPGLYQVNKIGTVSYQSESEKGEGENQRMYPKLEVLLTLDTPKESGEGFQDKLSEEERTKLFNLSKERREARETTDAPRRGGYRGEGHFRGGEGHFRGGEGHYRGGERHYRGGEREFRGEEREFRGEEKEFRGEEKEFRGEEGEFRGGRGAPRGFRGGRGAPRGFRGGRGAPRGFRGGRGALRGAPREDFQSGGYSQDYNGREEYNEGFRGGRGAPRGERGGFRGPRTNRGRGF